MFVMFLIVNAEQRNIVPSIDVRLVNILMRANLIAGNRGLSLYSMDQTSLNRRNWSDVEYNAALCFLRHRGTYNIVLCYKRMQ